MDLNLTVNELVETLKRSSLTTVLVEGKDDILIYRWIEKEIGIEKANFLSCGGRGKLLEVFERRNEFSQIKTVYVADKDCYVYDNVPQQYLDIIWTNGYSIENDLYFGGKIEKLLDENEVIKFNIALKNFVEYYAYEIENYKNNINYSFRNHPNKVLTDKYELCPHFLGTVNYYKPNQQEIDDLADNYDILIRGKTLFSLLLKFLSHKKRAIKHSKKALLEHCYKLHRNQATTELIEKINIKLCA
jgi:hypothetical protein